MWDLLGDVIEDTVAGPLVLQPLADEHAGGGASELAAAQHAVALTQRVVEGALVHLPGGIPGQPQHTPLLHLKSRA